eukprot:1317009-Rhodomonas_salina.1
MEEQWRVREEECLVRGSGGQGSFWRVNTFSDNGNALEAYQIQVSLPPSLPLSGSGSLSLSGSGSLCVSHVASPPLPPPTL